MTWNTARLLIGWTVLWVAPAAHAHAPAWRDIALTDVGLPAEELAAGENRCRLAAEQADGPDRQLRAHVAAANWWLAVPPARPATRWLLGLASEADLRAIHEAAGRAMEHLEKAAALLGQEDPQQEKRKQLSRHLETLRAFADVLAVAAVSTATAEGGTAWNKAVRGLAAARESGDEETAAAAMLWQAFALACSDRSGRALAVLPEALVPPQVLPFDYLARLLRCRILSEQGHHAASMALAIQVQAATGSWFKGSARRHLNSARRLAGWVVLTAGRRWHAALTGGSDPAALERLEALLADTVAGLTAGEDAGPAEVYYLPAAIPVLVPLPAAVSQPDGGEMNNAGEPVDSRPAAEPSTRSSLEEPLPAPSTEPQDDTPAKDTPPE